MVPSREAARRLVEANGVLVDGSFAQKSARMVDGGQSVELVGPPPRFVGRGGDKLAGALDLFPIEITGRRCLDAGSSTGGFTDCLLQSGAAGVVAVDVGTNQLHERLRADDRVVVMEQTDVRSLTPDRFADLFELVVGDLSFISLKLVLPVLARLVASEGDVVLLVKPQFEAGRQEASRGRGVITDPAVWTRTLGEVLDVATDVGLAPAGIGPSPLVGSAGNAEFVTWLRPGRPTMPDRGRAIDDAVKEAAERADRTATSERGTNPG